MSKVTIDKEQAHADFLAILRNSWTFARMTQEEQQKAIQALDCSKRVKGSYYQRWDVYQIIYDAFLLGVGYDGPSWREPEPRRPIPLF